MPCDTLAGEDLSIEVRQLRIWPQSTALEALGTNPFHTCVGAEACFDEFAPIFSLIFFSFSPSVRSDLGDE